MALLQSAGRFMSFVILVLPFQMRGIRPRGSSATLYVRALLVHAIGIALCFLMFPNRHDAFLAEKIDEKMAW
ncbi:MAG: hypothetical protein AB7C98_05610 [Acidithiobacillus sp.]